MQSVCKEMNIDIFQIHIKLADAHIFGFISFQKKKIKAQKLAKESR